jgi:large subunit ribosomal protein L24e
MVIKTETCEFSEFKIYPGKGHKFVSKDGKTHLYISKKCRHIALRKTKAQNIRWTTAWRRLNKKIKTEELGKKKKRRVVRVAKAIVGISLEDIKRKRTEKPEMRTAQKEQALREIKERRQKELDTKKKAATKQAAKADTKKTAQPKPKDTGKGKGGK